MGLDPRIGPAFLRAGIGFGGSCFPKDVSALKQLAGNSGYHFQLLTSVIEVNELQKRRVIGKLKKHLGDAARARASPCSAWPSSPRPTTCARPSSLVLAARLLAEGAEVCAYDPVVHGAPTACTASRCAASAEAAVAGADAAVLVTEWRAIVGLDWAAAARRMRTPVVIDGRNALDPARDDARSATPSRASGASRRTWAAQRRDAGRHPRRRRGHAACARSPTPAPSR